MKFRPFLGTVAALAMTALVGLGMASPALATGYGPESGSAKVSKTRVQAGGFVTVSGDRFCAGTRVILTVSRSGKVYITKTLRANSRGKVSTRVKLTKSGTNTIKLTGRQGDCTGSRVLNARVRVLGSSHGANAGVSGSALPGTGGVNLTPLWAGLGLLGAGALLVSTAHSRRRIHV